MRPGRAQALWAEALVASLAEAGVRDAVLSPGSRSTPLALALAETSAITTRVVHDERAAAFLALGHARVADRPPLLVCTSGSAPAHYLPALVEAANARLPLLVLTADRAPELQHRGAPQTIEQSQLFGHHARLFIELGVAEADERALGALSSIAARAYLAARWPDPGPVHLNAWLRKPLEPEEPENEEERARAAALRAARPSPPDVEAPRAWAREETLRRVSEAIAGARRGLIVAGPLAPPHAPHPALVARLAALTGFPLLAEAGSQVRFGLETLGELLEGATIADAIEPLAACESFWRAHEPDLVLQIGPAPLSSALLARLAERSQGRALIVLAPYAFPLPGGRARMVVAGALERSLGALVAHLGRRAPSLERGFAGAFGEASRRAWALLEGLLESEGELHEAHALRALAASHPAARPFVAASSLPARELDFYLPANALSAPVHLQRGAAGIEGMLAGAAGAAALCEGASLALGDVAFAHDLSGLVAARDHGVGLVALVLDNGGGRIFERLPASRHPRVAPHFGRDFLTPPGVDPQALARAAGLPAHAASTRAELDAALEAARAEATSRRGAALVHARLRGERSAALIDEWLGACAGALDELA